MIRSAKKQEMWSLIKENENSPQTEIGFKDYPDVRISDNILNQLLLC